MPLVGPGPSSFLPPSGCELQEAVRVELKRLAAFQTREQAKLLELAAQSIKIEALENLSRKYRNVKIVMRVIEPLRAVKEETICIAGPMPSQRYGELHQEARCFGVQILTAISIVENGEHRFDVRGSVFAISSFKRLLLLRQVPLLENDAPKLSQQ